MRRSPRTVLDERHGDLRATIVGRCSDVWGGTLDPALRVTRITGPGLMGWEDVHFSQAASTTTLRRRWERIKERHHAQA